MRTIAPILEHSAGKIRFRVDDVKTNSELLLVENAKSQIQKIFNQQLFAFMWDDSFQVNKELLAFSHDDNFQVIRSQGIHPLVASVHTAFSEHRPLLLTPDIIWITLAQGFSQHINNNAESLRSQFVRHQGKEKLVVTTDKNLTQPETWREAVQNWCLSIRDHVGPELYKLLECNFSTTTPITLTASHIVMMDAFKQYLDYEMVCVCGIPDITILGTVKDWQKICDRIEIMAQYDLNWWTDRLLPICQEFVKTAAGKPSLVFWRSIYKPKEIYGGEIITGWLADLFPYVNQNLTNSPSLKNPILEIPRSKLTVNDGISPRSLPLGLSQVTFTLDKFDQKDRLDLIGGFIGVHQQPETGILQAEIGWTVKQRDQDFTDLLDKIEEEHITYKSDNYQSKLYILDAFPKELIQMLERFNSAKLYVDSGHSWHIKPLETYKSYPILNKGIYADATHFIDLEDGRSIAYSHIYRNIRDSEWWIILSNLMEHPDDFPDDKDQELRWSFQDSVLIAKGFPQFFERIIQSQGCYYFDDPNFIPDDSFDSLMSTKKNRTIQRKSSNSFVNDDQDLVDDFAELEELLKNMDGR